MFYLFFSSKDNELFNRDEVRNAVVSSHKLMENNDLNTRCRKQTEKKDYL